MDYLNKMINRKVGPGGINCPCCAFGKKKDRQQFYVQVARKELKNLLRDEIQEAFWEIEDDKIDIAS